MRALGRLAMWLGAACLAALLLAAAGIAGLLWWSLPPRGLTADIPGLSAPVRVGLDANGIPRIVASTRADATAALGFLHARDRMFQMDLTRRTASGRLSEIAGASTLRIDRTMRTLGLRRAAEAEWATTDPETRALLEAYARGVNAWIDRRGRFAAPELIPFGAPEPWTPVDSLAWGKVMALYLSTNWRQEIARAALLPRLSPDQIRALWPNQDTTPAPSAGLATAAARLAAAVPAFPEPFTLPDSASNAWAVTGAHTATGAPLLAGDPHLAYGMPGIWYLARIQTPNSVLAGATAPGTPFLVIGHNGRIAWTFTTTGADTQDVFIETILPDGRYATPDGPRDFETRTETIRVLGQPDEPLVIRTTRHGPVLSDLAPDGNTVLAVAMAAFAPGDTSATGLLALNRAGNVMEAGQAAPRITAIVQNLLVADRQSIGLFTTGRIPLRRAGDGAMPVAGGDGAHDWSGFASGSQLPWLVDPPSGHLLNANERTAPPDFPVFMGRDWFGDWRAQRIRTLLEARGTHSVQGFAAMQVDSTSAFAAAMLPRLLQVAPQDAAARTALTTLRRWDGTMRADWAQPMLFNAWMRRFASALLQQQGLPPGSQGLPADMIARALGTGTGTGHGCGTDGQPTDCDTLLARTLSEAAAEVPTDSRWGDAHKATFRHPLLGRLPLVGPLFTWRTEQSGDDTTLFRGTPSVPDFESIHGPGFRGVYDLADLDRSVFALAPGQSGHPLSANAANLLQAWRSGLPIRLGPTAKEDDTIEMRP